MDRRQSDARAMKLLEEVKVHSETLRELRKEELRYVYNIMILIWQYHVWYVEITVNTHVVKKEVKIIISMTCSRACCTYCMYKKKVFILAIWQFWARTIK